MVTVHPARNDALHVTIVPGADVAELTAALATLPTDAVVLDHYGTDDLVLVVKPLPEPPRT